MIGDAQDAAGVVARAICDAVGESVRSVMLHGSLAAGGFQPGRSDIDLLVVVEDQLTEAEADAVVRVVGRAGLSGAGGIDLHMVTAAVAAAPGREPALELHVGRYGQEALEVERRVAAYPDLLAELSMARAGGRALAGAAPHDALAPVPAEWVVDRGRHWLVAWQSLTGDTAHAAFMVLTACRIWHFAVERAHCSKAQAARWALDRRPRLTAVHQALRQHEQGTATVIDEAAIAEMLGLVLRETG
ncbi:aminoglycoside adenylyltransferase domain-containing protein [Dactylosporangium sp. NPDC000521]|uniref:aminoglycoside adenylyltransferase domain-containing protein n=1 Tax=Dactylosporangium sp. NPDC000521 TaxID=3363975 RepID=UPI0036AEC757